MLGDGITEGIVEKKKVYIYTTNKNNKLIKLQFKKKCLKNVKSFNQMVPYIKFHNP